MNGAWPPLIRNVVRGLYHGMPKFRVQRYALATRVRAAIGPMLGLSGARPVPDPAGFDRTLKLPKTGETVKALDFQCNVCGTHVVQWPLAAIDRDLPSCPGCGSSVRMRSVVHLLSMALFGQSLVLPHWQRRREITGLGLSDWSGYGRWLALKTDYTNTFFHTEPRLDICNAPETRAGTADYLISTEVFEHVPPPASRAFEGAAKMLKPGGVFIFTTPFSNDAETVEHFPFLYEWEIVERGGRHVLINKRKDGTRRRVRQPRLSRRARHDRGDAPLQPGGADARIKAAGFSEIQVFDTPVFDYGIIHWHPWSLPILARKGGE